MLSNAYFLAKFRFDTAENEPAKNLQNFANFPNFAAGPWKPRRCGGSRGSGRGRTERPAGRRRSRPRARRRPAPGAGTPRGASREPTLQVSLPVVDNNRKVVGALPVVGKILAKICKFSAIF